MWTMLPKDKAVMSRKFRKSSLCLTDYFCTLDERVAQVGAIWKVIFLNMKNIKTIIFVIVEKNWKCNVKKLRSFNVFDFTKLLNCLLLANQIEPLKDHTLAKSLTKLKRYYIPDGTTGGKFKMAHYINKKFSKLTNIEKLFENVRE